MNLLLILYFLVCSYTVVRQSLLRSRVSGPASSVQKHWTPYPTQSKKCILFPVEGGITDPVSMYLTLLRSHLFSTLCCCSRCPPAPGHIQLAFSDGTSSLERWAQVGFWRLRAEFPNLEGVPHAPSSITALHQTPIHNAWCSPDTYPQSVMFARHLSTMRDVRQTSLNSSRLLPVFS